MIMMNKNVCMFISKADASKKNEANPLTEILKCPTKVVLLRVNCLSCLII